MGMCCCRDDWGFEVLIEEIESLRGSCLWICGRNVFTVSQPGLRAKMDWSLNRRIRLGLLDQEMVSSTFEHREL